MTDARLHLVDDPSGKRATFGDTQIGWLLAEGLIELVEYEQTGPASGTNRYRSEKTADEINELVLEQPDLRECDFCRVIPCGWRVNVRPFDFVMGPMQGTFTRPVFCCGECAELVRTNAKQALVERSIAATVAYAKRQGGALGEHATALSSFQIKQGLGPQVAGFVRQVFGHRDGFPERDTAEAA